MSILSLSPCRCCHYQKAFLPFEASKEKVQLCSSLHPITSLNAQNLMLFGEKVKQSIDMLKRERLGFSVIVVIGLVLVLSAVGIQACIDGDIKD